MYLTMDDLADRYHCSKRTIDRWTRLSNNPFPRPKIRQLGVSSLWHEQDVIAWENSIP